MDVHIDPATGYICAAAVILPRCAAFSGLRDLCDQPVLDHDIDLFPAHALDAAQDQ
ncbi:hypothetical protein D3C81_2233610 [compost metagenome]